MNITLAYAGYYGLPFERFVEEALALGFQAVQFTPDQSPNLPHQLNADRCRSLKKRLAKDNIGVSFHSIFYDINIVSVVPDVREFALSLTTKVLDLSAAVGAQNVTVHPGYMFPGWRSDSTQEGNFWAAAEEGIRDLGELAKARDQFIWLENGSYYLTTMQGSRRAPLHIGVTIEEMERLTEFGNERIGVCLDVGKAASADQELDAFAARLGGKVGQIQIGSWEQFERVLAIPRFKHGAEEGAIEIVFEGGKARASEFGRRVFGT